MIEHYLAEIYVGLMGLAILVYAILDGYDLGVGILLPMKATEERARDIYIASIGPFWDANETWLVLAIGILLIAFPKAHSLVLYNLYLPCSIMLFGLILRGVAFDFRAKAHIDHKLAWDRTFKAGSIITACAQGYMLGDYVLGFQDSVQSAAFACLSALGVVAAYGYIGSCWLIWRTEGILQQQAILKARWFGRLTLVGVLLVSFVNPIVNPGVFVKWFSFPFSLFALLLPTMCIVLFVVNDRLFKLMPFTNDDKPWLPFSLVIVIFMCCFFGIAFSFFPDIVPGELNIYEAMSAKESLLFLLVGTAIVVPCIIVYTLMAYFIFRGKASDLTYH